MLKVLEDSILAYRIAMLDPCAQQCPSSMAEKLRRRFCNQKIAGSNPASGYLATLFRKEI